MPRSGGGYRIEISEGHRGIGGDRPNRRTDRAAATYQGRAAFAVPWAAVICPLLSFTAVSTVSKFQCVSDRQLLCRTRAVTSPGGTRATSEISNGNPTPFGLRSLRTAVPVRCGFAARSARLLSQAAEFSRFMFPAWASRPPVWASSALVSKLRRRARPALRASCTPSRRHRSARVRRARRRHLHESSSRRITPTSPRTATTSSPGSSTRGTPSVVTRLVVSSPAAWFSRVVSP